MAFGVFLSDYNNLINLFRKYIAMKSYIETIKRYHYLPIEGGNNLKYKYHRIQKLPHVI